MYVVGGRGSGRQVWKLTRHGEDWKWTALVPLPSSETAGRWLAGCGVVSGRWLCLVAGTPAGKPSETRDAPQLQDWKLRLDDPSAEWEPMAPYPGGPRALVTLGAAGDGLYVFGGSHPDPVLRSLAHTLPGKYGIEVPYNGVPNYRDAYRYDPETDEWTSLRNLPFPMLSGDAVTLDERYILLMGSADVRTRRRGKTINNDAPVWRGYGDMILCYDIEQDNYSRASVSWRTAWRRRLGFITPGASTALEASRHTGTTQTPRTSCKSGRSIGINRVNSEGHSRSYRERSTD